MRECSGFYYAYEHGKPEKKEFTNGKFHAFGVDWEEIGEGVGVFTTAVIELQDGTMMNVPVVNIKFTSPEDNNGSDCLTVETDDAEHFREQIRSYTEEGVQRIFYWMPIWKMVCNPDKKGRWRR